MTRVLQFTSSYPRSEADNSSVFLRHLFTHLVKNKIEIHVLAPDDEHVCHQPLNDEIKKYWCKYFPTKYQKLAYGSGILPNLKKNRLLYLQVPFFLLSMFCSLLKLSIKVKPDFIHAHWVFPQGLIGVVTGKLLGIPVIITSHGGDAFSLRSRLMRILKTYTLKHCYAWTANTRATATNFVHIQVPSPKIIPMGVDTDQFKPIKKKDLPFNEKRKVILFVGRLVEKKGVKHLIEAYAQLSKQRQKESVLWIIGDGDQKQLLQDLTISLNIKNSVHFIGSVKNINLPMYYSAASVFVAPSIIDSSGDTEGQGVILLEAMACQVPIITTNIGGITEVVTNNVNALTVPQKDNEAISKALEKLLSDEKLRRKLVMNAYTIVHRRYEWKQVAQKYVELYK